MVKEDHIMCNIGYLFCSAGSEVKWKGDVCKIEYKSLVGMGGLWKGKVQGLWELLELAAA